MIVAAFEQQWDPLTTAAIGGVGGLILGWLVRAAMGRNAGPAAEAPAPAKPGGEALRLLALLQREGRLLDFLMEDVDGIGDAQVGAAVRNIHRHCQKALKEHLTLSAILPGEEDSTVTVPGKFDPSAIRLTGNVTGQPPFTGALRHHGWRVTDVKLAPPPAGADPMVVQPAEVEIG